MFNVHLIVNVKNHYKASYMLCVDIHTHIFNSDTKGLILQNVPQASCAIVLNRALIYENLCNYELELKKKKENGCLALWEIDHSIVSIELAKKFFWLMNTLFNKVLGENEKCVFYVYLKLNKLFGQPYNLGCPRGGFHKLINVPFLSFEHFYLCRCFPHLKVMSISGVAVAQPTHTPSQHLNTVAFCFKNIRQEK